MIAINSIVIKTKKRYGCVYSPTISMARLLMCVFESFKIS